MCVWRRCISVGFVLNKYCVLARPATRVTRDRAIGHEEEFYFVQVGYKPRSGSNALVIRSVLGMHRSATGTQTAAALMIRRDGGENKKKPVNFSISGYDLSAEFF